MSCIEVRVNSEIHLSSILRGLAYILGCKTVNINVHKYLYKGRNYIAFYYRCRNYLKICDNYICYVNPLESMTNKFKNFYLYCACDVKVIDDLDEEHVIDKYNNLSIYDFGVE